MHSPCIREASHACFHGCCPAPFLSLTEPPPKSSKTTAASARSSFASTLTSSLFPNIYFTNHESIPPISESFSNFTKVYERYADTEQADHIRTHEYYHLSLSNHVCLDYTGFGLFSHSQQHQSSTMPSSSSSPPPNSQFSVFNISYKSSSLNSQLLYGSNETALESAIRKRIMAFLNISETDYSMVYTANRASAFKLLAESYAFHSNRRLVTIYDHESEEVSAMVESSQKRGARVMSANFSWPGLRIDSAKLRKVVVGRRKKRKKGLFVFPLQSKMTGTRYSYLWMSLAQENGWHVLLDTCALGPKDMETLGLSLFRPDFLICSFFKVFGENPSGFGCLLVKRSSAAVLEASTMASGVGLVSIVPATKLGEDSSATESETPTSKFQLQEDNVEITSSSSGPISVHTSDGLVGERSSGSRRQFEGLEEQGGIPELSETEVGVKRKEPMSSEIVELEKTDSARPGDSETSGREKNKSSEIECRGLDHADSLGLLLISSRSRYLINWLVNALLKLRHPHSEKGNSLVRIYGPRVKFDRGPAVAFNVFDWKGEKVEPVLVQKLADRSNISLSCGFLQNIWFSDKYEEDKEKVLETQTGEVAIAGNRRKEKVAMGIKAVTATLGFLANFEDTYRLWAFVAKFLDADFVEKERWRYMALNQKTVEV